MMVPVYVPSVPGSAHFWVRAVVPNFKGSVYVQTYEIYIPGKCPCAHWHVSSRLWYIMSCNWLIIKHGYCSNVSDVHVWSELYRLSGHSELYRLSGHCVELKEHAQSRTIDTSMDIILWTWFLHAAEVVCVVVVSCAVGWMKLCRPQLESVPRQHVASNIVINSTYMYNSNRHLYGKQMECVSLQPHVK